MSANTTKRSNVLNSWEEISVFLGRGVRTVQRWERQYDLPIHRVGSGARSPVFALPSELNLWLLRTSQREKLENPDVADIQPTRELRVTGRSHTLLMRSRLLTSKLIVLTNIQRQRAE